MKRFKRSCSDLLCIIIFNIYQTSTFEMDTRPGIMMESDFCCCYVHIYTLRPYYLQPFLKILCPLSEKKVWNRNFLLRYSSTHWVLISYIFTKFHAAVNNRTNWLIDWLKDMSKTIFPCNSLRDRVKITSWPIFHVQMLIHSFIIPHAQCKCLLTHWRSWKKIDKQKLWSAGIYTMMS